MFSAIFAATHLSCGRCCGGEQALARGRAPTAHLHLSIMMDTAMMVTGVVEASQRGRVGKGLG